MDGLADFFDSVHGFFLSAGGSGLVTFLLAQPVDDTCDPPGTVDMFGAPSTNVCENLLGTQPFFISNEAAWLVATFIGLMFAVAATGTAHAVNRDRLEHGRT